MQKQLKMLGLPDVNCITHWNVIDINQKLAQNMFTL